MSWPSATKMGSILLGTFPRWACFYLYKFMD
jgi:hypothetical protein